LKDIEMERRATVERYHQLRDASEDFDVSRQAAASEEERRRLTEDFSRFRREHREGDVRRGKRAEGASVVMHQITWARWIQVADTHEAAALLAYQAVAVGAHDRLHDELLASLVAVSAATVAVEALYEDVRYLIPERSKLAYADERVADGIAAALGLRDGEAEALAKDLEWLYALRNEAMHGYAEPEAPQLHPAGLQTGAELARFNAATSRRALRIAVGVLDWAAAPPSPANRWVRRWAQERRPYHESAVRPVLDRLSAG
jgi:hypothetical protein